MHRSGFLSLILAVALVPIGLGCGDDEIDPNRAPTFTVPAPGTMAVDVSALNAKPAASAGVCHGLSALVVAWVNANVAVRLAVPTLAFAAAVAEHPVYLGDETWRWTTTGGLGNTWSAELEATVDNEGNVDWTMRISGTSQALNRFLWFSGTSNRNAVSGVWHYFDPQSPAESRELVEAEWSRASNAGAASQELVFRNVDTQSPDSGDVLAYSLTGQTAAMEFEDASEVKTSSVWWDVVTGEGSATNPQGETCCWGPRPEFNDVSCSQ